ncbi:Hypothetical protein PFR_JS23-PH_10 [Propionibacterium freudenreichii]|uniref:Uncharacterized protein n=1 Tax=Propionibacterium freudenreichii TaxID=1744 RepID=A0A509MH35_9ACTN|nr:Hypothetical protein PFR_JS23-PH_10 [Propionibacterium freudenreichii]SUY93568.1 Hypothetical protein PFR_JS23-PH_10 [Propionibacterium freudenreichii]
MSRGRGWGFSWHWPRRVALLGLACRLGHLGPEASSLHSPPLRHGRSMPRTAHSQPYPLRHANVGTKWVFWWRKASASDSKGTLARVGVTGLEPATSCSQIICATLFLGVKNGPDKGKRLRRYHCDSSVIACRCGYRCG